jgi:serine/threonine protein kinase
LAFLYFDNNNNNNNNNNNRTKYFCELYEFGKIRYKKDSFYALMENGGNDLSKIDFPLYGKNHYKRISRQFYSILNIIKECSKSIQVLHNIDIIHCDIKLENFLYKENKEKTEEYFIKIIDFGFCRKNQTIVDKIFGTPEYIPFNFYALIREKKNIQ